MFIDTHHHLNIAVDQVHPLLAKASPSPPPNELKVLTWPSKLPQSQSDRVPPRETSMDLTCSILWMLDCFGKVSYHDFICHHRLHQKQRTLKDNVLPGEMWMFPLIQDDDDITWLYSWLLVSLSMENNLLSISHSCGS